MYARKHRLHDQGLSRVDEVITMELTLIFIRFAGDLLKLSEYLQVFETS